MKRTQPARGAGAIPPASDEGPTVTAVAPQECKRDESIDSHGAPRAAQALRMIEGERRASQYLARLHSRHAEPDELALIVAILYGATPRGFCRVIEKAVGVRHA